MSTITCIKTPVIRADIGKIYYYLRNTNQYDFYNKLLFYYISMTSAGFFLLFNAGDSFSASLRCKTGQLKFTSTQHNKKLLSKLFH